MKHFTPVEIDFETGECKETLGSLLSYSVDRVRGISNPYMGNKRKLLIKIVSMLTDHCVRFDTVLDLFSGSGCFALVMKLLGKRVIANDLLQSSFVYLNAFVQNNTIALSKEDKEFLCWNQNGNVTDFVRRYYGLRFTPDEAMFLDNYRANVEDSWNGYKKNLAFASLFIYIMNRCFVGGRLNHGQVLSALPHRLKHQRNQGQEMSFRGILWHDFITEHAKDNEAFSMDAIDLLRSGLIDLEDIDVAYIDPPYGGAQSDYAHMYEFFESYIVNKVPVKWNHLDGATDFVSRSSYEESFRELLEALAKVRVLLISYNDSSWADLEKIKEVIKPYRKNIEVQEVDYKYRYRNSEDARGREYLILTR